MLEEPFREPSHINQARLAANSDLPVLLTGETGVGKDYLASFIHHHSPRRLKPFRNINCAAISPTLFESELFGYVRGAFTGAEKDRKGHVQSAEGGTLFLNEISTIPLDIQAKFLTTIDTHEYYRVGSPNPERSDFRLISATNKPLEELASGLREDLFHRIRFHHIHIPPLRERKGEIVTLARKLLEASGTRVDISHSAQELLLCYHFRGNVRELIRGISIAAQNALGKEKIDREDFPPEMHAHCSFIHTDIHPTLRDVNRCMMRNYVRGVVEDHDGDVGKAARFLRTSARTLYRLLNGKPSCTQ